MTRKYQRSCWSWWPLSGSTSSVTSRASGRFSKPESSGSEWRFSWSCICVSARPAAARSFISSFEMAEVIQPKIPDSPFVNEVRLNAWHWAMVSGIILFVVTLTPPLWKKLERFGTKPDFRIPYALSKDYWLYERRLQQLAPTNVVVLGDSVVWGEYVLPDGTLSHFLNDQSGRPGKFVNAGVNGLFPLALEGLVRYYGEPMRGGKVIVHFKALLVSRPKAGLRTEKEERVNNAQSVPQV